jgi:hypothetical protein
MSLKELEENMTQDVLSTLEQFEMPGSMVVVATYDFLCAIEDLEARNNAIEVYKESIKNVIEALSLKMVLKSPYKKKYAVITQEQKDTAIAACVDAAIDIVSGTSPYSVYLEKNENYDPYAQPKAVVGMAIELSICQPPDEDSFRVMMCLATLDKDNNYRLEELDNAQLH